MSAAPAVILGAGARTPLGFDRASSAAAVRCGIAVIAEHGFMIDRFGLPMMVTCDSALDPALPGPERIAELALSASQEALAPLLGAAALPGVDIVLSLGELRPGQAADTGPRVAEALRRGLGGQLPLGRILTHMGGHAGGIAAMEAGARLIAEGRAELVLAGGADSYLTAGTLEWLDETEQLHSEGNIYGFCPGEAAGFVLLAAPATARRLGIAPLLELFATGAGRERNLIRTEDICLGEGLSAAFTAVGAALAEEARVDRILCDMNGERYRGNEYGFAVLRNSRLFRDAADFEAPADCWGDVGAASGPLYTALAVEAEARGYAKGPLSLIWASSEGGLRGAALLRAGGGT